MAGLPPTSALREFPQLHRLAMLSPSNQSLVADYLANMQARHFAAASLEGVMRALKSFAVLTPASRQAVLYEDLSQTTPADIDAWIDASFQSGLAASTVDTRLRCGLGHMRLCWLMRGVLLSNPLEVGFTRDKSLIFSGFKYRMQGRRSRHFGINQ